GGDHATARPTRVRASERLRPLRTDIGVGDQVNEIAVELEHSALARVAQSFRVRRDDVEYRLDVSWRATDDAQELAGRRLLFERLLRLVEQPHVFNGNDGLIGEGLEQGDLPLREGSRRVTSHRDRPDGFSITEQRHR